MVTLDLGLPFVFCSACQMVTIQAYDQGKYGRIIGDVVLEDGRSLN